MGPASIAGFIEALRADGGWDVDRRLVVRPFPQPLAGKPADKLHWTSLRQELARQAGTIILIGGVKDEGGSQVVADGVIEEYALALEAGAFIIPIGAFGGAAAATSNELIGSDLASSGTTARRPHDDALKALSEETLEISSCIALIDKILKHRAKRV